MSESPSPEVPISSFPLARVCKWVAIAMVGSATALLAYAPVGSLEFKVYLGIIGAGAALGIGSSGINKGAALKALAGFGLLGALTLCGTASAAPADAPLKAQVVRAQLAPVPAPLPVFIPGPNTCERWDRSRRNWGAVGIVSGALATTGGLVSALGTVGEDRTARVSVAISSALLAGVGALAAYQTGEYASLYRQRCGGTL